MRKKAVSLVSVLLLMALLSTQAFAATTTRNFTLQKSGGGAITGTHTLTASRNSPPDNRYYGSYTTTASQGCHITFCDRSYSHFSSGKLYWSDYSTTSYVTRASDTQYAYTTSIPILKVTGVFMVEHPSVATSAMNLEAAY